MVTKTEQKPDAKPQPTTPPAGLPKAENKPEETYDWDALLPVVAAPAPTYSTGTQIDVLTEIPATIRRAVELSLSETVKGLKEYTAKGARIYGDGHNLTSS